MRYFQYYTSLADFPDPLLEQHETFLFDCDGLILDTEPLYTAAACQLIAELGEGLQLSSLPCSLKLSIMGRTRLAVAQRLTDWLQAAHGIHCPAPEWSTRVLPLEEALFARGCPLLPGAAELIRSLSQEKRLALATSSHRHSFLIKSQPHSATVFSHFHSIVCGDELGTHPAPSKPHPRIFQLAHLAVDSGLSSVPLAFEDSPNGVVAALRAGCNVVWVPGEEVREAAELAHLEQVIYEEGCAGEIDPLRFVLRLNSIEELIKRVLA